MKEHASRMCRERRKSNETSPADVMWLKVQTDVDDWKVVGSLYSVLTVGYSLPLLACSSPTHVLLRGFFIVSLG